MHPCASRKPRPPPGTCPSHPHPPRGTCPSGPTARAGSAGGSSLSPAARSPNPSGTAEEEGEEEESVSQGALTLIRKLLPHRPGGNPGANGWFLQSTPIQMPPKSGGICGRLTYDLPLGCLQGGCSDADPQAPPTPTPDHGTPSVRLSAVVHPGGNPGANLKSISHRCYLFEVAFVWELTNETIVLPLGCLQGGPGSPRRHPAADGDPPFPNQPPADNPPVSLPSHNKRFAIS